MGVSNKFVMTCTGLLGLYFVGLGLTAGGFATNYWLDFAGGNFGWFKTCVNNFGCDSNDLSLLETWQLAAFALLCAGIGLSVVGGATYMFVPVSGGFQIAGGLCTIAGVAEFGIYLAIETTNWDPSVLGYSFALSAAGDSLVLINGITLLALMGQEGMTMDMILPGSGSKVGIV